MGLFGGERRKSTRKLCSDLVEVSFRDPSGAWQTEVAVLEDVSTNGVCVALDARLVRGQSVWLEADGFAGAAEIRYCELSEDAYRAGAAFQDEVEWDPAKWQPKHVLDLPELDEAPQNASPVTADLS